MELDYVPETRTFVLSVPRGEADVRDLMVSHGLDFSAKATTGHTAILYTEEPYAALSFAQHGTARAKQALDGLSRAVRNSWVDDGPLVRCPADKELWPFQRANVSYALSRRNTLIADEPGLGKTPTAICFANEIKARRVLVITPASIRLQWANRIREWSTLPWPYTIHTILHGRMGVHPTAAWTIISYDLASSPGIGAALAAGHYDLLILDEAHYLKTSDAKRTRAVFGGGVSRKFPALEASCERVLALTGTPLPNRPREAYTLARALCWDAIDWASEDDFRERFNPSQMMERVNPETGRTSRWVREETGRQFELQNRLRANFMVRHLKRDVMPQLKLPVYDLIRVEESRAVRAALQAESLLQIDPEDLEGADIAVLGHVAEVRKQMGIAIAPQVADYVAMLFDGGEEKLVLFGWHIEVLNILEAKLAKYGVLRIDGRTSTPRRQARVAQFQSDPTQRLMLMNILSGGTGVDGLQNVACHALIAEPDWTPGNNIQAFDRLDRGGQTRTVQGDIFVAPNSFAERILAGAIRKLQNTHKVLDARAA